MLPLQRGDKQGQRRKTREKLRHTSMCASSACRNPESTINYPVCGNTPCVTMDYAFSTYTKFAFCITKPLPGSKVCKNADAAGGYPLPSASASYHMHIIVVSDAWTRGADAGTGAPRPCRPEGAREPIGVICCNPDGLSCLSSAVYAVTNSII